MVTNYPFPVPECGRNADEEINTGKGVWRYYAPDWSPEEREPLALACLGEWLSTATTSANALHAICLQEAQKKRLSVFGLLEALTSNLKDMLRELEEIRAMAEQTLPFDPVNVEWTLNARALTYETEVGYEHKK